MVPPDNNPDGPSGPDQPVEELLKQLSPSQILVLKTLAYEGWLSRNQLKKETRLPERTVKRALSTLEDHSLIAKITNGEDGRKANYNIRSCVAHC